MSDYTTIITTRGQSAIVDNDYAWVAQWKWQDRISQSGKHYARRTTPRPNRRTIQLHVFILEHHLGRKLKKREQVDHINGDSSDNRLENLRLATNTQNARNRGKSKHNTSGYKGVFWHKATNKWTAQIGVDRKRIYLGIFDTPELAHRAYCEAAKVYHGEFANVE